MSKYHMDTGPDDIVMDVPPVNGEPVYLQEGGAFGQGSQAYAAANPASPAAAQTPGYEPLSSRGAQGLDQTWADLKSIGSIAAGFVPGVGEALDAKNAYDAAREGDYVGAGVNAAAAVIGAVPIVGDVASLGLKTAARNMTKATDWVNPVAGKVTDKVALAKDVAFSADIATGLGEVEEEPVEEFIQNQDGPATTSSGQTDTAFDSGWSQLSEQEQQEDTAANSWDDSGDDDHGAFSGGASFSSGGDSWGAGREEEDDWDDEEAGSWQDWNPEPAPAPSNDDGGGGGGGGK